jgi:hypothetical protein
MSHRSLPKIWGCAAVMAAICIGLAPYAWAQQSEAPSGSKGENFSAKPPAQLFATDCTGAGCHKSPQGLAKQYGIGLAGFLREHYTNSRESAAALANYLNGLPAVREPKEARKPRGGKPEPAPSFLPGWFGSSPSESASAKPSETRPTRQRPGSRTAARPDESGPREKHDVDRDSDAPKPNARERGQRNRPAPSPAATAAVPPSAAAEAAPPAAAPESAPPSVAAAPPAAAPTPPEPKPAPAPPPAPKKYDIFD